MPKKKTPRNSLTEGVETQAERAFTPCRNLGTPCVKSSQQRKSWSSHKKKTTPFCPRVMAVPLRPGKRDSQSFDEDYLSNINSNIGALSAVIDKCASIRLNSAKKGSPSYEMEKENAFSNRSPSFHPISRRRVVDLEDSLGRSPAMVRSRSEDCGRSPPSLRDMKRRRTRSSSLTEVLSELGVLDEEFIKPTARLCTQLAKRAKNIGIKVLALDWDCTVIKCHTRGSWYGSANDLGHHVRPFFKYLIRVAPKFGIHIAIVTFSGQTSLVQDVMQKLTTSESDFSIRCCDDTWDAVDDVKTTFPSAVENENHDLGKLPHIASVLAELNSSKKMRVSPSNTLLIDDDTNNIKIANDHNIPAIHFDVEDPMSLANGMCELFEKLS